MNLCHSYNKRTLTLDKEDLQKIIDQLESSNSKDEAYFGIFQYGSVPGESFVKANKQGLELFAVDILKASRDADEIVGDKEKTIIPLDCEEEWIEGDIVVHYIEPTLEKRKTEKHEHYNKTWKDNAMEFGCFAGLIIVAVALIVGLVTMAKWIF
jgi:hypothetical protein